MKKIQEFWDWDEDIDEEELAPSRFLTGCFLVGEVVCLAGAVLSFFL